MHSYPPADLAHPAEQVLDQVGGGQHPFEIFQISTAFQDMPQANKVRARRKKAKT